MDNALIWGGVLVVLLAGALFFARRSGKATERASRHEARAKDERGKSDALQEANATPTSSIRDRLRRNARKR